MTVIPFNIKCTFPVLYFKWKSRIFASCMVTHVERHMSVCLKVPTLHAIINAITKILISVKIKPNVDLMKGLYQ